MTTATASAPGAPTAIVRATGSILRLAVLVVLALVLAVGAFAVGRATASDASDGPTVSLLSGTPTSSGGGIELCHDRVPC